MHCRRTSRTLGANHSTLAGAAISPTAPHHPNTIGSTSHFHSLHSQSSRSVTTGAMHSSIGASSASSRTHGPMPSGLRLTPLGSIWASAVLQGPCKCSSLFCEHLAVTDLVNGMRWPKGGGVPHGSRGLMTHGSGMARGSVVAAAQGGSSEEMVRISVVGRWWQWRWWWLHIMHALAQSGVWTCWWYLGI